MRLLAEIDGWKLYRHFEVHDTDFLSYNVVTPDCVETSITVHQHEWAGDYEEVSAHRPYEEHGEYDATKDDPDNDWRFVYHCQSRRWGREPFDALSEHEEVEVVFTEDDVHPVLRALWWFVHECLDRLGELDPNPPGHGSAFEREGVGGG